MHANGTGGALPQPEMVLPIRVYSRPLAVNHLKHSCGHSRLDGASLKMSWGIEISG